MTHEASHRHALPLTRREIAERIAGDIPEGAVVNLGIGMPTLVSDFFGSEHEIILHSENGMLGLGPAASVERIDPDLTNAGKTGATEVPGASYFHHADSFGIMRGRHLDIAVLGAFQVSARGDIANWFTGEPNAIPSVGGAMDLAAGAQTVFAMMELFAKDGSCKLVRDLTFPVTGLGCVSRVYTDRAVFDLDGTGTVRVTEVYGTTVAELRTASGIDIIDATA